MAKNRRKEFGRRGAEAPPVVTNAPNGFAAGLANLSRRRKRSLGIGLVSVGALSLVSYAFFEGTRPGQKCPPDQSSWDEQECSESSSRGGSSSRGSSSSRSYSSSSGSSVSSHGVSFGGFGSTGSAHSGGGG